MVYSGFQFRVALRDVKITRLSPGRGSPNRLFDFGDVDLDELVIVQQQFGIHHCDRQPFVVIGGQEPALDDPQIGRRDPVRPLYQVGHRDFDLIELLSREDGEAGRLVLILSRRHAQTIALHVIGNHR